MKSLDLQIMTQDLFERQRALEKRFWKSVGKDAAGMLALRHRVGFIKTLEDDLLASVKGPDGHVNEIRRYTRGDVSVPHDDNLSFVSIKEKDSEFCLMRFYEKNVLTGFMNPDDGSPEEQVYRVGPCEYRYPDGMLAGLELYEEEYDWRNRRGVIKDPFLYGPDGNRLDHLALMDSEGGVCYSGEDLTDGKGNVVPQEDYDRVTSVYFAPDGSQISSEQFDVCWRAELEKAGLIEQGQLPEYAPRIKEYKNLVRDIWIEACLGGDRFSASDLREMVLAGRPEAYLDMLKDDVMRYHHSKDGWEQVASDDFLESQLAVYVYGEVDAKEESVRTMIDEFRSSHCFGSGVERIDSRDGNLADDLALPHLQCAARRFAVGTFTEPDRESGEDMYGGHQYVRLEDDRGRLLREYFVQKTERGQLVEDGPDVTYYPDGRVAMSRVNCYSPWMNMGFPEMGSEMYIDRKGRLSNFSIVSSQLDMTWDKVRRKDVSEDRSLERDERKKPSLRR